jgi:predicted phosphodiesterase
VKIGLFSDVHGNAVAFDALLADLERHPVDRLVCLGDVIQGGPQPVECLERLRSLDCPVVMGNADWYVLTGDPGRARRNQRAVRGAFDQLSGAREFVRSFTPTVDEPRCSPSTRRRRRSRT